MSPSYSGACSCEGMTERVEMRGSAARSSRDSEEDKEEEEEEAEVDVAPGWLPRRPNPVRLRRSALAGAGL